MKSYPIDTPIAMPADPPWPAAVHRFDAKTVAALDAAEVTGRPLLIRGDPGVGKSMTARAAAFVRSRPLLTRVIDSRMEADDLKARFDTVRRLADAQERRDADNRLPPPLHYLQPDVLWWGFNWTGAQDQKEQYDKRALAGHDAAAESDAVPHDSAAATFRKPVDPDSGREWSPDTDRAVVLLDEIDKADPELPNALLEALGSNAFTVPVTGGLVRCDAARRPLVIITTNEERELSAPFLRRCLVLWLELPKDEAGLVAYLARIAEEHQRHLIASGLRLGACAGNAMQLAAHALWRARREAEQSGAYRPGTAEYLDLVAALAELHPDDETQQVGALAILQEFVLKKSAGPQA